MFDVPPKQPQRLQWTGDVPIEDDDWQIGLIVGASGSGKTTVARSLFGSEALDTGRAWGGGSVIDDFPPGLSIVEIADICQAVGFNTIPAWMRPYAVLSNGEKFRVELARRLAETDDLIVMDEFTSVVDRQVAQIGSHAVQKFIRKTKRKFVAVSCHSDIIDWLQPDWILEPATMQFQRRSLQRRPEIAVTLAKVPRGMWDLFAPFHYLTQDLFVAAQCYALFVGERPAAFAGVLHRPHPSPAARCWGVSRLVTLPDFQGLGLAFVLVDGLGKMFRAAGKNLRTYPAHPALIGAFGRSKAWRQAAKPGYHGAHRQRAQPRQKTIPQRQGGRPNAVFEYIGPAHQNADEARQFLQINALG